MSSYYYVQDPDSEYGFTPIPEDEYIQAVFRVAKNKGVNITEKMIIEALKKTDGRLRECLSTLVDVQSRSMIKRYQKSPKKSRDKKGERRRNIK